MTPANPQLFDTIQPLDPGLTAAELGEGRLRGLAVAAAGVLMGPFAYVEAGRTMSFTDTEAATDEGPRESWLDRAKSTTAAAIGQIRWQRSAEYGVRLADAQDTARAAGVAAAAESYATMMHRGGRVAQIFAGRLACRVGRRAEKRHLISATAGLDTMYSSVSETK
jgi:hypothetical protein